MEKSKNNCETFIPVLLGNIDEPIFPRKMDSCSEKLVGLMSGCGLLVFIFLGASTCLIHCYDLFNTCTCNTCSIHESFLLLKSQHTTIHHMVKEKINLEVRKT